MIYAWYFVDGISSLTKDLRSILKICGYYILNIQKKNWHFHSDVISMKILVAAMQKNVRYVIQLKMSRVYAMNSC